MNRNPFNETIGGERGWDGACELAGCASPGRLEPVRASDELRILAHFYETQRKLPSGVNSFLRYASELGLPLPAAMNEKATLEALITRFVSDRTARGLETPSDGPLPGDELSKQQTAALIADVRAAPTDTRRTLKGCPSPNPNPNLRLRPQQRRTSSG